jgi:predicted acylesterase/phospholipase RssA
MGDAVTPEAAGRIVALGAASVRASGSQEAARGAPVRHASLALAGGGPDGAFGAGLLAGWTERGDRPEIDVVTGVSTGAILAIFAVLGMPVNSMETPEAARWIWFVILPISKSSPEARNV